MDEKKIINVIKKTLPSLVAISLLKKEENKNQVIDLRDKSNKTSKKASAEKNKEINGGSGFFVEGNLILTNKHVIYSETSNVEYEITTYDNKKFKAELISKDPINDIAILKVRDTSYKFKYLKLGDSSKLVLGQFVLSFGNVFGIFKNTVSFGMISGLSRSVKAKSEFSSSKIFQEMRGLIQTDAAINPGNSGGPLVNLKGEVIGINVAMISGAQNISFAIPINAAKRDLKDIKKFGKIIRPYLGIRYIAINDEVQDEFNLPINYGVLVTKEHGIDEAVIPQSPAYLAGIKEGDIIFEWNNIPLNQEKGVYIQDLLEKSKAGEEITLKILRKGKILKIKLTLGERKAE
jgi:serine protease Do